MNNKIILSTKSNKSRIWQAMLGTMTFFISSAGMEETGPFLKLSILDTLRSEIKRSEEQIQSITEIIESKKRDMTKKANREIEEAESKIQKAKREIKEAKFQIKVKLESIESINEL